MHSEHHIDGFDLESFFKLHDLDNNGVLDVPEIEAVYGLHHHSVAKKVHDKDARAKEIVSKVLEALDTNHDGELNLVLRTGIDLQALSPSPSSSPAAMRGYPASKATSILAVSDAS